MIDYNVVKHCRMCKQRFLVGKSEAKLNFCAKCQVIYDKNKE